MGGGRSQNAMGQCMNEDEELEAARVVSSFNQCDCKRKKRNDDHPETRVKRLFSFGRRWSRLNIGEDDLVAKWGAGGWAGGMSPGRVPAMPGECGVGMLRPVPGGTPIPGSNGKREKKWVWISSTTVELLLFEKEVGGWELNGEGLK